MECLEMAFGWVGGGARGGQWSKNIFSGQNSFRFVYNQNIKSKIKVKKFHIFLTASGEGGVNPSGQPDRFFPVFFLITSLSLWTAC